LRTVLATTYHYLRRYDDLDRTLAEITALTPSGEVRTLPLDRAWIQAERTADLTLFRQMLPAMIAAKQIDDEERHIDEVTLALFSGDQSALSQILADPSWTQANISAITYPKEWFAALAARMRGDQDAAVKAFAAAREKIEKTIYTQAYQGRPLSVLAIVDAGLGRQDQAVEEAKRACELTPFSTLNLDAPVVHCNLAVVYAWTGQDDLALAELSKLIERPSGFDIMFEPTYGDLRLNPLWDPLRSDPRFEALAKKLAPLPRAAMPAKP
jgi:tetratricopeptide (TPR) repeat protein